MKIAIIQLGINDEETKEQRLLRVEGIIDKLKGSDLIILPELWNIGFFSYERYHTESETLDGELVSRLSAKARKKNSYIFTGSFVEERNGKFYNTCVLLDRRGQIIGDYSKIHLFGYGSKERELLSAGEKIEVIDTEFGKVGLSICYDLRFPELYRRMADKGAEIIISCAAWPYPRVENWDVLNKARAIENQCYYLASGCAGTSKGKAFIGRSMVVDPWGTVVTSASERETILKAEIYPENVPKIREEFTPLKDRILK
ncbi:carbon-nitrogen family hydrolase [Maledivibacter halophilus]|uniref:Carbon-nitrogen hydrolase n=1 Tax=Maledivibacter halophilus TaxID=36842 RepID=A0A1T5L3K5_9FIRM|nr:carbon-nitrogen family hydrolase [Maledivibacter halophilus]SKC70607.1 Carbon-nitrogen hydrolase [Maledivibacter halophilus]